MLIEGLTYEAKKGKIFSMSDYAICNISGKQYKVTPNMPFNVDLLDEEGKLETEVMLISQKGKLSIGTPVLKEKITLDIVGNVMGEKVRVSKFHAKANYRRTTGIRPKYTRLVWTVKKEA